MKKIFILFLLATPTYAHASIPTTSCPHGYTMVNNPGMTISATGCSIHQTNLGTTTTCLINSPDKVCTMYAPANTPYSDNSGTYEINTICPLE